MNNEAVRVLEMIQDNKISAAEGVELLNAFEFNVLQPTVRRNGRFIRVRVSGDTIKKVNINISLKMVKVFSSFAAMGMKFLPAEIRSEMEEKGIDLTDINIEELLLLIDQGLVADEKLVDVDTYDAEEGRVRVEVFVE